VYGTSIPTDKVKICIKNLLAKQLNEEEDGEETLDTDEDEDYEDETDNAGTEEEDAESTEEEDDAEEEQGEQSEHLNMLKVNNLAIPIRHWNLTLLWG
jgi:hypothetical protein